MTPASIRFDRMKFVKLLAVALIAMPSILPAPSLAETRTRCGGVVQTRCITPSGVEIGATPNVPVIGGAGGIIPNLGSGTIPGGGNIGTNGGVGSTGVTGTGAGTPAGTGTTPNGNMTGGGVNIGPVNVNVDANGNLSVTPSTGGAGGAGGATGGAAGGSSSSSSSSSSGGGGGGDCCMGKPCSQGCSSCSSACSETSAGERDKTKEHITEEFKKHREWMVKVLFEAHILPALMLFAEQITAMAMHQVVAIGTLLDAKHQLETQRVFQSMMAQAHKDYHPSEGMCTFGTATRSLAASDRNMDLTAMAISNRVLQRELLSGEAVAGNGRTSDYLSRIKQFVELYCDKADNGKGLQLLCPAGSRDRKRVNNDINYTALFDAPLTLKLDFTEEGDADHSANMHSSDLSADEEDIFALSANLYAHNVAPTMPQAFLTGDDNTVNERGTNHYLNIRAIAAKRSVARNSFSAIAAMKSQGEKEVQPYLYAIMKEFGMDETEIKKYLGERPSYYAQMEILTKKLYQNPVFYADLYDKPVNVERKTASMQAIELMQRRDIYRSVLRSEAVLSVMLETALMEPQEEITNEINRLTDDSELVKLPE